MVNQILFHKNCELFAHDLDMVGFGQCILSWENNVGTLLLPKDIVVIMYA